jgi:hypothetical protein
MSGQVWNPLLQQISLGWGTGEDVEKKAFDSHPILVSDMRVGTFPGDLPCVTYAIGVAFAATPTCCARLGRIGRTVCGR